MPSDEPPGIELKSYSLTVDLQDEKPDSGKDNHEKTPQAQFPDIPEVVVHPADGNVPEKDEGRRRDEKHTSSEDVVINSDVFIELLELSPNGLFLREKARWIKFEENVEPCGEWGRPFLPYIECESLRHARICMEKGLVSLSSINDGMYDLSHVISSSLVLGGHVETQHRARLQQILTLPRIHQGESAARCRKKIQLRPKYIRISAERRRARFAHAWQLSDNEVRNRWVKLVRLALRQRREENPEYAATKAVDLDKEFSAVKYLLNENGQLHATHGSDLLSPNAFLDTGSVTSENFSDISGLIDTDVAAAEQRGLPMTKEQAKLRKILHPNSIGIVVLHAPVDFLKRDQCVSALIRFQNEHPLADTLELSLPVKFFYVLYTSKHTVYADGFQTCRAMGALFQDKTFRKLALQARTLDGIQKAFFAFIDGSVMLPPGNWQPELLTPIAGAISAIARKKHALRKFRHRDGKQLWRIVRSKIAVISLMKDLVRNKEVDHHASDEITERVVSEANSPSYLPKRGDCPLRSKLSSLRRRFLKRKDCKRTIVDDDEDDDDSEEVSEFHPLLADGRWFGGLRREIRQRYPLYWTDIKEGLHIQCLATILYLAISLIAMSLTYGQVIAKYTKNYMGASEMLLATSFSCMLMALFGTEPLAVIAGTAAMLIFENTSYQASEWLEIDFMQLRWLTGMWIFIFLVLILAFDKAHWIHYCTRFTEEILHVLVALLFMYEGIKNLVKIYEKHPVREEYIAHTNGNSSTHVTVTKPNTALMYTIVMFATFSIAMGFRLFEKTRFFSPRIRRLLNYFSIPVAVNVMNALVYFVSVYLNTIHIPPRLELTAPEKRSLYIIFDSDKVAQGILSYWVIPIATIPALLTVILLFIESEITLLECYKETRGRKGSGFHVNLLIVAVTALGSSFRGLPWMCLAGVETSVHLDSLKVWSSFDAPGVKSHVLKIREQRLTLFFSGLLVGLSSLIHGYLDLIPEAVFSGMVLYMGIVSLFGVQMIERFFLIFMAPGQHPDIAYLKNVPLLKVYLFTMIQVVCIVVLWIVKSFSVVSPAFPLFVLLMIPLRALLGKVFTQKHAEQLDNEDDEEGHGALD